MFTMRHKQDVESLINIIGENYRDKISYEMFGKIPKDPQEILKKAITYRDDEDWYTLFTESKINNKKSKQVILVNFTEDHPWMNIQLSFKFEVHPMFQTTKVFG